MPRIADLNSVYPTDCPFVNQIRREHAGRVYFMNKGYITYYLGDSDKPGEHQLVAALAYGPTPPGYHVHHKNEVKTNNAASNLEVLTHAEHIRRHRPLVLVETCCAQCGALLTIPQRRASKSPVNYCDSTCHGVARRKVQRPSVAELLHLMESVGNWTAIAKGFGVSDNAVRKWAKRYGLDLSMCNGWRKAA